MANHDYKTLIAKVSLARGEKDISAAVQTAVDEFNVQQWNKKPNQSNWVDLIRIADNAKEALMQSQYDGRVYSHPMHGIKVERISDEENIALNYKAGILAKPARDAINSIFGYSL